MVSRHGGGPQGPKRTVDWGRVAILAIASVGAGFTVGAIAYFVVAVIAAL